ncbi:MAG: transcriptional repressor [Oscillospiraceae bacterium]|jgi:Fur family peroxide stress response transcriptional regulator|nr:transcriptional repressor [Oscillospiraceae bacterium]
MMDARRTSARRDAIADSIRGVYTHPSAAQVYDMVRSRFPSISLGTVYRNIAQLQEDGTIRCVGIVHGQERYDGNVSDHVHFVCEDCGAVIDLDFDPLGSDPEFDGAVIHRRELAYYGLCRECVESA